MFYHFIDKLKTVSWSIYKKDKEHWKEEIIINPDYCKRRSLNSIAKRPEILDNNRN